jgi:hypothetical protein
MIKKTSQTSNETIERLKVPNYLRSFVKRIYHSKMLKVLLFMAILSFFNIGNKSPVLSTEKAEINHYPQLVRERMRVTLVSEVKTYIGKIAPDTKVKPSVIVDLCLEYNINITFVLAQGLLESHFGTKGMAIQTNSIFNVGTWDSKKVLCKYKDQNESIEPFLKLLTEDYLTRRTLKQLLNDGGYKNKNGHRYAASPTYEASLRATMMSIYQETNIQTYQDIIDLNDAEILAFFGPVSTQKLNGVTDIGNLTAMR